MLDRLPPLHTLRAFEAAGRHLSMSRAADELHVTHGAVSRSVKTLETHLGVELFHRMTRRIVLTELGAEFHVVITRMLRELARESDRIGNRGARQRFGISTSVSFASKWLAPRLHRFKSQHPEFEVHLDVTDLNVDLNGGQFDAAIRYGSGRYRGVLSERILDETVTPVCSPAYLEEVGGLDDPAKLLECTLLHEDRMLVDWSQWLAFAGVVVGRRRRGPAYSHGSMAIEAAMRGEGVVLGRSAIVTEDICAGRLVAPFPEMQLRVERGYDLVYAIGKKDDERVSALRRWLANELNR